jgi:hypothetical protein
MQSGPERRAALRAAWPGSIGARPGAQQNAPARSRVDSLNSIFSNRSSSSEMGPLVRSDIPVLC